MKINQKIWVSWGRHDWVKAKYIGQDKAVTKYGDIVVLSKSLWKLKK